jgi:POT family proton-dependent oligopeptide transporter
MLKEHPRGLLVAFFANMGERFGFYTMMSILVLFLQAKYGLSEDTTGLIYSVFYFLIYGLSLVGGFMADRVTGLGKTIMVGIMVMFAGYILMAVPVSGLVLTLVGLFTIALGNGLFKGNLQALVGNLYEDAKYTHLRDSAFSIFYMGINIGAFFAPSAARSMRNWLLHSNGFEYNAALPALCHQQLGGTITDPERIENFRTMATAASHSPVTDLDAFASEYVNAFATGYHYAFGIAAGAMLGSLAIYILFNRYLKPGDISAREKAGAKKAGGSAAGEKGAEMTRDQEKQRLTALGLVFVVVIFFWMSFHQNGLTLTFFARDYTETAVGPLMNVVFDLRSLLSLIAAIIGLVLLVRPASTAVARVIGAVLVVAGGALVYYFFGTFGAQNTIEAEIFQQFNPIFIVFLTPVVVGVFGWLRARGKEPSTPRKIGIGMIVAGLGFAFLIFGSFGLTSPAELGGDPAPVRAEAHWLINTYFILTIAELFLSPMGISFVSKVAPPRFKGMAQGGWLAATAIGNQLLFVGSTLWNRVEIWQVWLVFVVCCAVSAAFIFSVLKRLEKAATA